MLAHRRKANRKREEIGRGKFRWGPSVTDPSTTEVMFQFPETLEEHETDTEDDEYALVVVNGVAVERKFAEMSRGENAKRRRSNIFEVEHLGLETAESGECLPNDFNSSEGMEKITGSPLHPVQGMDMDNVMQQAPVAEHHHSPSNSPTSELDGGGEEQHYADSSEVFIDLVGDDILAVEESPKLDVMAWVKENQVWVDLYNRHGLELTVMDDILRNLRAPVKSWKTVIANICAEASLLSKTRVFPTCPGHMCFARLSDSAECEHCSECGSPRPEATDRTSVHYIPVLPRIESMLMDEQKCAALFQYHQTFTKATGAYSDFMDSRSYQRICEMYGSAEAVAWDIFIAASTDGFQAYKNRTVDVWPVLAILLNLPPDKRYAIKNILPLMFIPDERQPSNLQSFLTPLINEVNGTLPEGVEMRFYDGTLRKIRLHLVWFSTDLDALTKIASLTGHNGKTPCRFCEIQGVYCNVSRHYYFPCSVILSNRTRPCVRYNPNRLPLRSEESIYGHFERLRQARTATDRTSISKETGIKGESILLNISSIVPYVSFPVDIMHLFYNLQRHLLGIQMGDFDDAFCLSKKEVEVLESELLSFADGISGQMAPKPRKLSAYHSWKAAEHKMFTLSYYMILLDGYIPESHMNCLGMFVDIVDICFRTVLSEEDVQRLSKLSVSFTRMFEKLFMRYSPDRLRMCTYVMHLVLHLAEGVLEMGPLVNTSQYWVERYIGWIVDRLNAKRLPAASFRNRALFSESYKMAFSTELEDDNDDDTIGWEEEFQLVRTIRVGSLDSSEDNEPNFQRLFADYLTRKYDGITLREAETIAQGNHFCRFWAKVRFKRNGIGQVQTASISSHQTRSRPSCYIATEMDASESSSDVYYGKLLHLLEIDVTTADARISEKFSDCVGRHCVAVVSWARRITRGKQLQLYIKSGRDTAFSTSTMEDISIFQRLIGVVEHSIPSVAKERRGVGQRSQQRTYFVDSDVRQDFLLCTEKVSSDGMNRILRGMSSDR